MITVWCVYWGDKYPKGYVYRIKREVEKYLTVPHRFVCLTDQKLQGIDTVLQVSDKPGWWQKIDLFTFSGPALYLDLDIVLTGNIDCFIGTDKQIRMLKNWAVSGHGGCQSSIMYWDDARVIYDNYDPAICGTWPPSNVPPLLWGDQELCTLLRDNGTLEVDYFDPALALSYKYHCRQGLPDDCRAVIFHGDPKPATVSESWLKW